MGAGKRSQEGSRQLWGSRQGSLVLFLTTTWIRIFMAERINVMFQEKLKDFEWQKKLKFPVSVSLVTCIFGIEKLCWAFWTCNCSKLPQFSFGSLVWELLRREEKSLLLQNHLGLHQVEKSAPGTWREFLVVDGISKSTHLTQTTDALSVSSWVTSQWQGTPSRQQVASSQWDRTCLTGRLHGYYVDWHYIWGQERLEGLYITSWAS